MTSNLTPQKKRHSKAIGLLLGTGELYEFCDRYHPLGKICRSRGETEKTVDYHQAALEIASSFNWHDHLFWNHFYLAQLSFGKNWFDDAHAHTKCPKSHAINNLYYLDRAMELQADVWYEQRTLKEAKPEALCTADIYERFEAAEDTERCRALLWNIEKMASREIGKLPNMVPFPTLANSPFSARGTVHRLASLFRYTRPRTIRSTD